MPCVVLCEKAAADLAEIWDYIADDSEDQADAFIAVPDDKFAALARAPRMGRERPELAEGLRSFPAGRYLIFHVPVQAGIEVVRVLHAARDLEELHD